MLHAAATRSSYTQQAAFIAKRDCALVVFVKHRKKVSKYALKKKEIFFKTYERGANHAPRSLFFDDSQRRRRF